MHIDYDFFLDILTKRKTKLHDAMHDTNNTIRQLQSSHIADSGDFISASSHGENIINAAEIYKKELQDIEVSLKKIKDGTFGICEMCDDEIHIERLKAKPHAKYCIKCRELFERDQAMQAKLNELNGAKDEF